MFQIEAMVLGSLAWRSDSPLFDAIEAKGSVPSYEEVCNGGGIVMLLCYNLLLSGVYTS